MMKYKSSYYENKISAFTTPTQLFVSLEKLAIKPSILVVLFLVNFVQVKQFIDRSW